VSLKQFLVKEFHKKYGHPAPDKPGLLNNELLEFRIGLLEEELDEFIRASWADDLPAMVDALVDLIYVVYGTAVAMGVNLDPIFAVVHKANMEKIPNGQDKPIKPEGWKEPDIVEELRKQGWKG
jgi:predicted HAD superfamily Cof-like phosphohydrolase